MKLKRDLLLRKGLVMVIIIFFTGLTFLPSLSADTHDTSDTSKTIIKSKSTIISEKYAYIIGSIDYRWNGDNWRLIRAKNLLVFYIIPLGFEKFTNNELIALSKDFQLGMVTENFVVGFFYIYSF
jgi:hypothetical protein